MADFAAPNLFQDRGGANVPAAIESGFGMGLRKQDMNMRKQAFANEQADREEMRNAMADYGQASDDESRQEALSKVGVVSPEARAKLEDSWVKANNDQREAMKAINDDAGGAAYLALQEQDPSKRAALWDKYRNGLPESVRRAVPADADDLSLKAVMAQSADARDTIMALEKIAATGEKQKEVASYQGGINRELENLRTENDYGLQGNKFKLDERQAVNGLTRDLTKEAVKNSFGGKDGDNVNSATIEALQVMADNGNVKAQARLEQVLGLPSQPQSGQEVSQPSVSNW